MPRFEPSFRWAASAWLAAALVLAGCTGAPQPTPTASITPTMVEAPTPIPTDIPSVATTLPRTPTLTHTPLSEESPTNTPSPSRTPTQISTVTPLPPPSATPPWPEVDTTDALLAGTGISQEQHGCGLWWVDQKGQALVGLPALRWPRAPQWIRQLTLSPDRTRVALSLGPPDGGPYFTNMIINLLDGTTVFMQVIQYDYVLRFSWSSDGTALAVSTPDESYLVDPVSGELRETIPVSWSDFLPALESVSFAGSDHPPTRLAFLRRSADDTDELVVREEDGTDTRIATTGAGRWLSPTWTSEGMVVVAEYPPPNPDEPPWMIESTLVAFSVEGGERHEVTFDRIFYDLHNLQLSPDGTRLLALMDRGRGAGVVAYPVLFDLDEEGFPTGEYTLIGAEPYETWIDGLAYWADRDWVVFAWPLFDPPLSELYMYHVATDTIVALGEVPDSLPPDLCP